MRPVYFITWSLARLVCATYFRWRTHHAERVPAQGPVIIASNHASFMDPPLIGAAVKRDLHYLARDTLFRHPLANWAMRSWNSVPVDREGGGAAGLKAILDRLRAGGGIILFPEGTRSPDGRFLPAKPGIGLVILKSACPVVPVRVFGTYEAFGRHLRLPRPRQVVVKFGQPLTFAAQRAAAAVASRERLKGLYQEVADETMRVIMRLEPADDITVFPAGG